MEVVLGFPPDASIILDVNDISVWIHVLAERLLAIPAANIETKNYCLDSRLKKNRVLKILKKKYSCYYHQPQIDVQANKIIAAEMILRWKSMNLGLIVK